MVAPTTPMGQGLPNNVGQGLPNARPQQGFLSGPESNQFGSWGEQAEVPSMRGSGNKTVTGIPGELPGPNNAGGNSGIDPGPFNPGDKLPPPKPKPPDAPDMPGTYVPWTLPTNDPARTTSSGSGTKTTPTAPDTQLTPAQQQAELQYGEAQGGYILQGGKYIYSPVIASQYVKENPPTWAEGGAIPMYDFGGPVSEPPTPGTTEPPPGGVGQHSTSTEITTPVPQDAMGGIIQALGMARQSFGLDHGAFGAMFGGGDGGGGGASFAQGGRGR